MVSAETGIEPSHIHMIQNTVSGATSEGPSCIN
jgi:hypothetical protein